MAQIQHLFHPSRVSLWLLLVALGAAVYVQTMQTPTWTEQQLRYQTHVDDSGQRYYIDRGQTIKIDEILPYHRSALRQEQLNRLEGSPPLSQQWVWPGEPGGEPVLLRPAFHYGVWSLLPALIAIALCVLTREPVAALFCGVTVAALMLGRFNISDGVLIPALASENAASLLLVYLWLLGGLMGLWARTGAALAFARLMTERLVRGPRSAKFISWCMGLVFFQGGSISTVLVGTTVRPMADKARVSHEEMSYIVDSTASPVAAVLPFNAWPIYVQGMIFIPGVSFLATEADRIAFFFASIPFSFYAILALLGTLLVSQNKFWFAGKGLKTAMLRARDRGELDEPDANPVSAPELTQAEAPKDYQAGAYEFILPLTLLIAVAIGTYLATGSPRITWAFGAAFGLNVIFALAKGLSLRELLAGIGMGLKGVVMASVLLILAMILGNLGKELGGGIYLVENLTQGVPFWALPVLLQLLTMVIAFSTGTSFGTFAVAFPLAMPLAWGIAEAQQLAHAQTYLMICFATVLNGSVFGDQCSPISDTTVLSAMTTGCDLMDHVRTQIVPASYAAATAALLWTLSAWLCG